MVKSPVTDKRQFTDVEVGDKRTSFDTSVDIENSNEDREPYQSLCDTWVVATYEKFGDIGTVDETVSTSDGDVYTRTYVTTLDTSPISVDGLSGHTFTSVDVISMITDKNGDKTFKMSF